LNVTYRRDRGEPRMSLHKAEAKLKRGEPAGACVDCGQCIAVCPTGVDIREGSQLGCIQCGLCIDACDRVMEKIGRQPRLIAYDTDVNCQRRAEGKPVQNKIVRARTVFYAVMIALVGGVIRNAYTIRILNKHNEPRQFELSLSGLPGALLEISGGGRSGRPSEVLEVGPDRTQESRLLVTNMEPPTASGLLPVQFKIVDTQRHEAVVVTDHFVMP
jgi:polyferredoxin